MLTFEATQKTEHPADVEQVCNYVNAMTYARREITRPKGLPLSTRLLCETHKRLMHGQRGSEKLPGEIRRSQNWIGGTRPGNARFVPPPPDEVPEAMSALEQYLHGDNGLPPLVRAGLAHVQFETIHPFLDGNDIPCDQPVTVTVNKCDNLAPGARGRDAACKCAKAVGWIAGTAHRTRDHLSEFSIGSLRLRSRWHEDRTCYFDSTSLK